MLLTLTLICCYYKGVLTLTLIYCYYKGVLTLTLIYCYYKGVLTLTLICCYYMEVLTLTLICCNEDILRHRPQFDALRSEAQEISNASGDGRTSTYATQLLSRYDTLANNVYLH
jgi:hypothetical protein